MEKFQGNTSFFTKVYMVCFVADINRLFGNVVANLKSDE